MVLGFTLPNHSVFYATPFVLRPWFVFCLDKAMGNHLTLPQNYDHPQRRFVQSRPFSAPLTHTVFSRFEIPLSSTKETWTVHHKRERENKASATKRNVRQILFMKSTNIALILSYFTALNMHPIKSVCKETLRGCFWSHRQSSCLKYTSPHLLQTMHKISCSWLS